jgi:hypothetical protein
VIELRRLRGASALECRLSCGRATSLRPQTAGQSRHCAADPQAGRGCSSRHVANVIEHEHRDHPRDDRVQRRPPPAPASTIGRTGARRNRRDHPARNAIPAERPSRLDGLGGVGCHAFEYRPVRGSRSGLRLRRRRLAGGSRRRPGSRQRSRSPPAPASAWCRVSACACGALSARLKLRLRQVLCERARDRLDGAELRGASRSWLARGV